MLFSQISADDPQHLIWINESRLFTILIKQSRSLENAAIALKELLAQSS